MMDGHSHPQSAPLLNHEGSRTSTRLRPLNSWHAPPSPSGGLGLSHTGRERRRREILEQAAMLDDDEHDEKSKRSANRQQRRALCAPSPPRHTAHVHAVCTRVPAPHRSASQAYA
jgi:hypothetical protein